MFHKKMYNHLAVRPNAFIDIEIEWGQNERGIIFEKKKYIFIINFLNIKKKT